ncbi:hypothetical protein [Acinetobacter sp. BHS4]|uniref:hypothetical protein n=1 Tax=Acinetobacter sp. BHS4 TaxID=2836181 RepID=UPI001BCB1A91|nr:hypothetical protein [Acinetobacter sp. BHS4]QVR66723.1 hypothetical protein KIP84_11695 [Acinetobacter sp. BHS4]
MRSIVDLCNLALSHLAQGYVVNEITEPTKPANLCNTYYPICRRELLDNEHQWTFAVKRVRLNVDAGYEFGTAYVLPSDKVRLFQLESGTRFYVEGNHLFTDDPAPVLRYVHDVKDLALMPDSFKLALSYLLAGRIAGPLTQSEQMQMKMMALFGQKLGEAIFIDLQQHRLEKRPEHVGSMTEVR